MTTITTDRKWKQIKYRYEVPTRILKRDLDWTTDDDVDGYFRYRGQWYNISEFEWRDNIPEFDGIHCDTFYSGIVLKLSDDGETYKVGTLIA